MRYAKIDRRMYGDEKYRRLTAPDPCGQALWWHLLAGKQLGIIPGLFSIGQAAFAEQLGWSLKGFQEAFREVSREGMAKADWDAPLVWVPNAIRYNRPANPNVVQGWHATWDELPECQLKVKAWEILKAFMEGLHEGFGKAFQKSCPNPLANQDQEQYQEQEQDNPPNPPKGGGDDSESKSKTPAKRKNPYDPLSPELPFASEAFRAAWVEWAQHRSGGGKGGRLTEASAKKQLEFLAPMGEAAAVECLNASIRNNWQGLFPPNGKTNGHPSGNGKPHKETQSEMIDRVIRETRGQNGT